MRLELILLYPIMQCWQYSHHFPTGAVQLFVFTFFLFHLNKHGRQKGHEKNYRKSNTSISELVWLLNSLLSQHTSEVNLPGLASSTRPTSTSTPDSPGFVHTTGLGQLSVSTVGASDTQRVRNNLTELQRHFLTARGRLSIYTSHVTVA